MTKTVIACYDDYRAAQRCAQDLTKNGFDGSKISIVANGSGGNLANPNISGLDQFRRLELKGIGAVMATGPMVDRLTTGAAHSEARSMTSSGTGAYGARAGSLHDSLTDIGIPDGDAGFYAEGVRRGGTLISLPTSDDKAEKASDIMQKYDPADVHGRADYWKRNENWQGFNAQVPSMTEAEINQQRAVVPKIEEQMRVGKHEVEKGGMRVHTYVTEKPVEKTVNLRKESVDVERRKVDRPASEEDLQKFKESTIRIPVVTEEADVSKQARVTEEVVIHKDVKNEPKKVQDTVRETHVDTERVGSEGRRANAQNYDIDDPRFRKHFEQTYGDSDYTFEQYRPAYQYGYNLAAAPRYQDRRWDQVEPDARQRWEATNPDASWDMVDCAVEAGYKGAKGKL